MRLKRITITICEACLDGVGSECHTPGCALFMHRVDLPIAPELYGVQEEFDVDDEGRLIGEIPATSEGEDRGHG